MVKQLSGDPLPLSLLLLQGQWQPSSLNPPFLSHLTLLQGCPCDQRTISEKCRPPARPALASTVLFCYIKGKNTHELNTESYLMQHKKQEVIFRAVCYKGGFPGGSGGKEAACNAEDLGSIPGSERFPWRREWQPSPVFLPGEFMDRGAWWATVHGVAKSQTQLSD